MKNAQSQKGKKGTVGAPSKPYVLPKGKFTMKELFALNSNVCELTLRNNVNKLLKAGKLAPCKPVKQPDNHVGRPQASYKRVYGQSTDVKTRKTRSTPRKTAPVTEPPTGTVVPAAAPTSEVVTVAEVVPAPVVVENVVVPATPAPEAPVATEVETAVPAVAEASVA